MCCCARLGGPLPPGSGGPTALWATALAHATPFHKKPSCPQDTAGNKTREPSTASASWRGRPHGGLVRARRALPRCRTRQPSYFHTRHPNCWLLPHESLPKRLTVGGLQPPRHTLQCGAAATRSRMGEKEGRVECAYQSNAAGRSALCGAPNCLWQNLGARLCAAGARARALRGASGACGKGSGRRLQERRGRERRAALRPGVAPGQRGRDWGAARGRQAARGLAVRAGVAHWRAARQNNGAHRPRPAGWQEGACCRALVARRLPPCGWHKRPGAK